MPAEEKTRKPRPAPSQPYSHGARKPKRPKDAPKTTKRHAQSLRRAHLTGMFSARKCAREADNIGGGLGCKIYYIDTQTAGLGVHRPYALDTKGYCNFHMSSSRFHGLPALTTRLQSPTDYYYRRAPRTNGTSNLVSELGFTESGFPWRLWINHNVMDTLSWTVERRNPGKQIVAKECRRNIWVETPSLIRKDRKESDGEHRTSTHRDLDEQQEVNEVAMNNKKRSE
ncbi:hypothetical protein C8R43DRAFT_954816 [Mycena crocata]|nr:hypothetical protein C8R43DRAFT_954816 [Mycena crocata]